jgi:hypothetical protein
LSKLPLLLSQLSKIVLLNYSPVFKNINAVVGVAKGGQTMGDHRDPCGLNPYSVLSGMGMGIQTKEAIDYPCVGSMMGLHTVCRFFSLIREKIGSQPHDLKNR